VRHRETVMGIPMSVDVRDKDRHLDELVEGAFEVLRAADRRFSRYRPGSEVSRFGRGALRPADLSADLREVLALAGQAWDESGGAFSVRRPDGTLDTDGVVKGWAAQRAADVLKDGGLRRFCLNAGGDVVVQGEPEPGRGWRVGIRDPGTVATFLAVLELRDGAVATSGTYERGAHVWDGRTGESVSELVSASVVATDLTKADILATTVLALGRDGVDWASEHGAVAVVAVDAHGRVLTDRVGATLLGTTA
jgi:thiamine biosynthesis lipoprotein